MLTVYERKIIAAKIISQLGGQKFKVMTGAKDFNTTLTGVSFRIPSKAGKPNFVQIGLNKNDLYDVEFFRIWGTKVTEISNYSDIYVENLVELFESETGLYTKLF